MIPFCCCVSSFVSHFLPVIKNSYSMFSFVFFISSDIFSDIFLQIFYLHSSRQSRIKVSACATACPLILLRFPVKWYSPCDGFALAAASHKYGSYRCFFGSATRACQTCDRETDVCSCCLTAALCHFFCAFCRNCTYGI